MPRSRVAALLTPALLTVALLSGCGEDEKVGDIQVSPEAVKADDAGRAAMEAFIQSKSKAKSKAKSVPAAPIPGKEGESGQ